MRAPSLGRLRSLLQDLAVAVPLSLVLLSLPRTTRAQQLPAGFDQGIMEVHLAGVPALTTPALVAPDGTVLLPVGSVLALTGLPVRAVRLDTAIAIPRLDEHGDNTLDWAARRLTLGDSAIALDSLEIVRALGETYLASKRLAAFMESRIDVDFSLLAVTITRAPPFPSQQATEIAARRSAAGRRVRLSADGGRQVPYSGGTGGFVFDWSLASTGTPSARSDVGELRAGAALAGGDLTVGGRATRVSATGQSILEHEWSYRRVFPDQNWLRQVEVGQIVGGGPVLRSINGFTITNQQVIRDPFFTDVAVAPSLPQGWQYEVYQNGQLVGYSDAAGGNPVMVPLRYGGTPVEVRMIGPAGQQVTSNFLYQVPATQLSPGRFEYSAGGGACASGCNGLGYVDLAYGARTWLTLGSGLVAQSDTGGMRYIPSASVSVASYDGASAQLQVVPSVFSRLTAQYAANSNVGGVASFAVNDPGSGSPSILGGEFARWNGSLSAGMRLARPTWGATGVRLGLDGEGAMHGRPAHERIALDGQFGIGTTGITYEYDAQNRTGMAGLENLLVLPYASRLHLRNLAITSAVSGNGDGVGLVSVGASVDPGRGGSFGLTVNWRAHYGNTVTLAYATAFPFARANSRVTGAPGNSYGALSLGGTAIVDGFSHTAPSWRWQGGVGAAGVSGRVFYDLDGDGSFGPRDSAAAGIAVLVAGHRTVTDSTGHYKAWNVVPYEVAEVTIDTLRGIDPSWTPQVLSRAIRPTPHVYSTVDFPLRRTEELSGTVIADAGVATAGGVTLFLHSSASTDSQRVMTYGDGGFYVSRLRPGTYWLRVSRSALQALGAESHPDSTVFTIAASDPEPVLELPPIHLALPPTAVKQVVIVAKKCPNPPAGVPLDADGCPIIFRTRTITLRGVNFDLDKATLTPASLDALTPLAAAIASDTSLRIEVAGYTDATGSRDHNIPLSQARAESVRQFFIAHGVDSTQLVARGYGPDQPVATNRTAAGRALNRRTELHRLDHAPAPDEYTVQVQRVNTEGAATALVARLTKAGFAPRIVDLRGAWSVRVGRFATRAEAAALLRKIVAKRFRGATVTVAEPLGAAGSSEVKITEPATTKPTPPSPTTTPPRG